MNFWYVKAGEHENIGTKFAATVGILFGWMLLGGLVALFLESTVFADPTNPIHVYSAAFSYFLFLIGGLALALRWFSRPFKTLITNRKNIDFKQYLFGFGLWLMLLSGSTIIGYLVDPSGFTFTYDAATFWIGLVALLIWLPIQTGAEELFFRGYLPQILSPLFRNQWALLLISSMLFSLPHLMNPEAVENPGLAFLVYALIGMTMGIGVLITGSLEIAMGMHLANNLFGLAVVGYANSAVPGTAIWSTPAADLSANLISGVIYLGIWYLLVRWLWPRIRKTTDSL